MERCWRPSQSERFGLESQLPINLGYLVSMRGYFKLPRWPQKPGPERASCRTDLVLLQLQAVCMVFLGGVMDAFGVPQTCMGWMTESCGVRGTFRNLLLNRGCSQGGSERKSVRAVASETGSLLEVFELSLT